jgi:hypothetical protein
MMRVECRIILYGFGDFLEMCPFFVRIMFAYSLRTTLCQFFRKTLLCPKTFCPKWILLKSAPVRHPVVGVERAVVRAVRGFGRTSGFVVLRSDLVAGNRIHRRMARPRDVLNLSSNSLSVLAQSDDC